MTAKRPSALKRARATLPSGGDREAFLDAAYALIGEAWVRLDEKNGRLVAVLTPKDAGTKALGASFRAAYGDACARRKAGKAERALMAAALSRALAMADHVDARRREPEPSLPPERLAEIAALLAEHEAERKDYGAVRTPWEDRRKGGGK